MRDFTWSSETWRTKDDGEMFIIGATVGYVLDSYQSHRPAARHGHDGHGAECAASLGGQMNAGPRDGRGWRVRARLELRRNGVA